MVNITLGHGRENILAVVDISEGGASVAIINNPHAGPASILSLARFPLSYEARSKEQAAGMISQQIQEAARMALKQYADTTHHTPIHTVYAIVHAPWVHTISVNNSSHTPEDVRVQDSMIESLAKKALSSAIAIDMARLFEASVSRIQLNGYTTRVPAGKYAHTIDVTSLISDCDAAVKTAAISAIQSQFPVATIVWRSSLRSLIDLVQAQHIEHRLIIDMGADSTHIVSVREGVITERIVPEGIRTILARIAPVGTADQTLTRMRMLAREACSDSACEDLEKALAMAEPELARVFGEAIGALAATQRVANELLLVTHADLQPWLMRFFSRIDFSQFTVTTLPFEVRDPSAVLSEFVSSTSTDTSLLVGAALVNIESHQ